MSKIALSSNASGTGVFTIASLGTNTNQTLTLPDASGTVLIDTQNINLSSLVTLSGSDVDFTGIPSTARRVTVMFNGLSSNSTVVPLIQLGDAGGIEATGYVGATTVITDAGISAVAHTTGVGLSSTGAATLIFSGSVSINLMDATTNMWVITGVIGRVDAARTHVLGYTKSLSATLTQVRLAAGAASSFDAGSAAVSWE
jgi:hypothetical protein